MISTFPSIWKIINFHPFFSYISFKCLFSSRICSAKTKSFSKTALPLILIHSPLTKATNSQFGFFSSCLYTSLNCPTPKYYFPSLNECNPNGRHLGLSPSMVDK